MIRHALLRQLQRAGRLARRMLGAPEYQSDFPAASEYLRLAALPGRYSRDFEPRTFVFELLYVSAEAGGLADILDLGQVLVEKHGLRVFYRVPPEWYALEEAVRRIRWSRPGVRPDQVHAALDFTPEYLCATAWPTAYRVLQHPSARKLYFVQDYEPWFRPAGVERWYAARSYELGLEIFTLGPWLQSFLKREHRVTRITALPFPVVHPPAAGRPWEQRNAATFYVQPEKPHRGAELLVECARRVARRIRADNPGIELVLFGSHELQYMRFDFPCRVMGVLDKPALSRLVATTRVGVSASFTNLSLLPPWFVAQGCWAVDLDLPNVTTNLPDGMRNAVRPVAPDPEAMAATVLECLDQPPPLRRDDLRTVYER
ncbi:MAG TPA: hypothetical protein EYP62_05250, partial [Kiritimatiellae bacterium]|nr:hypothetical protein [Kiritimatiellia bacterium]